MRARWTAAATLSTYATVRMGQGVTTGGAVRHVAVVGLMGSGKTTVGARLAALLGWPLRDSDAAIESSQGRTVRELRDELGVDAMHALEARQLLDALAEPGPSVICPAASVADVEICLVALAAPDVFVVFLTATPAVAAGRFQSSQHRPWYGDDPAAFLAQQALVRYPRLRALDPLEIATDDRTPDAIVGLVVAALAARGVAVPPGA
ncbi:MAG TPA: shikimate kinase [Candidatus Limnocylindrales bacterium]